MSKELIDIEELRQDNLNFNKGTYEGEVLIKKSLERFKAGRSVLIDKDNNIIAGNKTVQAAATMGMKVRVIETTGDELVARKAENLHSLTIARHKSTLHGMSLTLKPLHFNSDLMQATSA